MTPKRLPGGSLNGVTHFANILIVNDLYILIIRDERLRFQLQPHWFTQNNNIVECQKFIIIIKIDFIDCSKR